MLSQEGNKKQKDDCRFFKEGSLGTAGGSGGCDTFVLLGRKIINVALVCFVFEDFYHKVVRAHTSKCVHRFTDVE